MNGKCAKCNEALESNFHYIVIREGKDLLYRTKTISYVNEKNEACNVELCGRCYLLLMGQIDFVKSLPEKYQKRWTNDVVISKFLAKKT